MIIATVAEIGQKGIRLILPGETVSTQKYYNALSSYDPVVGERVAVIENGGTLLILGKLKY